MRRPLELRTTRTGFPARQFLDSAPNLSLSGASQLRASALQKGVSKREKEEGGRNQQGWDQRQFA